MFFALTFHYVYANISSAIERKPRYMEPVKLVKREDSLAYARRHDGNGVTPPYRSVMKLSCQIMTNNSQSLIANYSYS